MNEEDKNKLPAPGDVAGQIKKYCRLWEKDGHEERDKFLRKLFPGARLSNDGKDNTLKDTDKILIQICALDTFYGTGTPSEFLIPLAKQILDLESDFKERVSRGCPVLVADIAEKVVAKVKAKDGKDKTRRNNSLATKYCSFHNSDKYPIYDSYVGQMLLAFNKEPGHECFYGSCKLREFTNALASDTASEWVAKNYEKYCGLIKEFRKCYKDNGKKFSVKDIDRYLWQVGKKMKKNKKAREKGNEEESIII